MIRKHCSTTLTTAVIAALVLTGCKPNQAPPVAAAPASTDIAPPAQSPAATVQVTGVELGTALGADGKVVAPAAIFAPTDTVIVAIATATSDAAATVPGTVGAKWSDANGKVINDESKAVQFNSNGNTDFRIAQPGGWNAGKYRIEVLLNGSVVQTREFEIR